MIDEVSLTSWQSQYQKWVDFAKPLISTGKAKDAFAKYPWFSTQGEPFTKLKKPASETHFGLVTTGGYSISGEQEPMRAYPTFADEIPQIRHITMGVDRSKLKINHPGYDHKYAEQDINANLPFDRLQELVDDGIMGSIADETLVLMGLQPNVEPLIKHTIPQIVDNFNSNGVEAALLVPS